MPLDMVKESVVHLFPFTAKMMKAEMMKLFLYFILLLFSIINAEVIRAGVNRNEAQNIVNIHNEMRLLIANGQVPNQPKAINMKRLQWDDRLAAAAQQIADTLRFKHKTVKDARFFVGQNLYLHTSYSTSKQSSWSNWNGCIEAWFDEHKDFVYPSTSRGVTGHYTQIVWADTKFVGCGFTYFKLENMYQKLYVCNYGPAGNYLGQAPYKTGKSGCEQLC